MTETTNGTSNLDWWIREQSFRAAYSEVTKGFIGKKALRELLCDIVPPELGYTKEQVRARLATMLADDLTPDLLRECDARRKAPSAGAGAGVAAAPTPASGPGSAADRDMKLGGPSRVLDKGKQRAVDPVDVKHNREERAKLAALASGGGQKAISTGPAPLVGESRTGNLASLAARLEGLGTAGGPVLGVGGYKKTEGRASARESVESSTTIPR
jgi:hypothetical protein